MPILIVLVALVIYSNCFNGQFILDDNVNLRDNPTVHQLLPSRISLTGPPHNSLTGRPVSTFVFALNYHFSGLKVQSYHFVNLIIHILCALTFWGIMRRTLRLPRIQKHFIGAEDWLAAVIASLFVAHPMETASVSYISQRIESLTSLFYLLTLYFFIRGSTARSKEYLWFAIVIVTCLLGMGSKETMVSAPLFILLYDRLLLSDTLTDALRQRRWFYAGLAATWLPLIGLMLLKPHSDNVGFYFPNLSWLDYLKTQSRVIVLYLQRSFWPGDLVLYYGKANADVPILRTFSQYVPWAAIVLCLLGLTLRGLLRRNPFALIGAWFFLILGPSSSILAMPTEVIAEYRMYLPLAAVITATVLIFYLMMRQTSQKAKYLAIIFAGVAIVALAIATYSHNKIYRSPVTLWTYTAAKQPRNTVARTMLGVFLIKSGHLDEGMAHFEDELRFSTDKNYIYKIIPDELIQYGLWRPAQHYLREGAALNLTEPSIYNNLAWIEATASDAAMRDGPAAVEHARRAIALSKEENPSNIDTLAAAYAEAGKFEDAIAAIEQAIAIANQNHDDADVAAMQGKLAVYRAGKPFRGKM
ncbi:MAG TPA: hypothetical protein VKK61_05555 [Tepidisphaeraceae bacterium]|nr:hypothetical protein [Tepidisphaeraceae bacterium]